MANTTAVCAASRGGRPLATSGSAGAFTVTTTTSCGPELPGIARGLDTRVQVAVRRHDPQAIGADRGAGRRTGDDRDVGAAARKPRRDMATDRTGAVNADLHAFRSLMLSAPSGGPVDNRNWRSLRFRLAE